MEYKHEEQINKFSMIYKVQFLLFSSLFPCHFLSSYESKPFHLIFLSTLSYFNFLTSVSPTMLCLGLSQSFFEGAVYTFGLCRTCFCFWSHIYNKTFCVCVCVCVCLAIFLPIYLQTYLSACLSVYVPDCLCASLSIFVCVCAFACLSVCLSACLSVCLL